MDNKNHNLQSNILSEKQKNLLKTYCNDLYSINTENEVFNYI